MLDINSQYKRNENIILKSLSGKYWALDMEGGDEYTINEVSYDMLDFWSSPHTLNEVVDEITNLYDVSKDTLIADCKTWLPIALEKGLIEKV